jgi:hypothetical protein
LFHADGQTDMTKLIVALRDFANAPKKRKSYPLRRMVKFRYDAESIDTLNNKKKQFIVWFRNMETHRK